MSTISLRLSNDDTELFRKYAALNGISLSELVRQSVLERLEDEYALKAYENALDAYRENPVTFSHADVKKMFAEVD